jgi:hypothetical protein
MRRIGARMGLGKRALFTVLLSLFLVSGAMMLAPGQARAESGVVKEMTFLLHSVNATETAKSLPGGGSTLTYFDTTLEFNDENVTIVVSGTNINLDFYLVPALAGDFMVSEYNFKIWSRFVSGASNDAQITVQIHDRLVDGSEQLVAETNFGSVAFSATPELKVFSSTFADYTFDAGHSIKLRFAITPGFGKTFEFYYDTAQMNSRLGLISPDSIDITGMTVYDSGMAPTPNLDPTAANMTMYIDAQVTDPLGGYDIVWVNVTILDPLGGIVVANASMVRVAGTDVSFESTYRFSMNYSGLATGVYEVHIWALDRNGHNLYYFFEQYTYGDHPATFVGWFSIGVVYWVNFLVEDDMGLPVEEASVMATQGGAVIREAVTNSSGMVNLTLGSGSYVMLVEWHSVVVYDNEYMVSDNVSEASPVVLSVAIYYPSIQLVDSQSEPVADASVFLTYPSGEAITQPLWTDDEGTVALGRSPGGTYGVAAYWKGIEVYRADLVINSSSTFTLGAEVYYVTLTVVDSQDIGIEYSHVVAKHMVNRLVLDFGVANETGVLVLRVPGAEIDFEAYLADVRIGVAAGVDVNQDISVTIFASVYYITFTVVDSHDIALEGATVSVASGGGVPIASETTNASGMCVVRIPSAALVVTVSWQGVEVYDSVIDPVTADATVVIDARVYYLTVVVDDRDGNPVADAAVHVGFATGNEMNTFGYTDSAGTVVFRLPGGEYNVTVRLQTTYLMTKVDLVQWHDVDLVADYELAVSFEDYKPPLYVTRAFQLGIVILLLAAFLAALFIVPRLKKKAEK